VGYAPGITRAFDNLVRRHQVPGAQLALYLQGETVEAVAGVEEYGTSRVVTPDSRFPTASITKAFTATTVMILVEDGDLELDLPLGAYLPELGCGAADVGGQVTLRHVLSHTSGLPDIEGTEASSLRRYVLDNCDISDFVLSPGSGLSYSNLGYGLAGLVVEEVTGMSWWRAVECVLLKPLGLRTSFVVSPEHPYLGVTGHSVSRAHASVRPVTQTLSLAEAPIGGVAASASELLAFGRAHLDEGRDPATSSLLELSALRQMRHAVVEAEPFGLADGWGLGLAWFQGQHTEWWGHDGAADGICCYLRFNPETDCVIALTTNSNTGLDLWAALSAELGDLDLPEPNYIGRLPEEQPASLPLEFLGAYVNGTTEYSVVLRDDGQAYFSIDDEAFTELTFYPSGVFATREGPDRQLGYGCFVRDPGTGKVSGLHAGGRFAKLRTR
jgi:CubicO group peptidase (beta-lactamase class C family)